MYIKLVLNENANAANVLSLLSGLLTGQQTSLSGLSNIQAAPNSEMVNTVAGGWSQVYLSATELVVTAPMRDFATLKYLRIRCVSNQLLVSGMTGWNAVTFSPINGTTETAINFTIGNWAVLKVWATNRYVVFQSIVADTMNRGLFCLEFDPVYSTAENQNFFVGDYFPCIIHPETRNLQFNVAGGMYQLLITFLLDNQASSGNQVLKLDTLLAVGSGVSGQYFFAGKAIDIYRVSVCPKESLMVGLTEFSVVNGSYYDGQSSDFTNFLVQKG